MCKYCVLCAVCQWELGGSAHSAAVSQVAEAACCTSGAVGGGALPEPGPGARQGPHITLGREGDLRDDWAAHGHQARLGVQGCREWRFCRA